ncbi:toll/interleukin-1 receptor domain-containing protein [Caulobacter henricii]|uniref:TIR domain-containing protein n=1 Tax=Caulobacter henricii TaxID=69395 RepID=A0A0P0NZH5_9CAUL|nr:toll/interleukin-1 receptor domain-containing protein [Caulobacter henricii]ALL13165.1 hypothetical protein AQ619_07250 [Caulobacter henricii]
MAEFITRSELRAFAASRSLTEQAELRKSTRQRASEGSTFLSHSSKDEDLVVGATIVLENHGARVYTDEVDPEMPPYTTDETANLLKKRIQQTKKFVLLVTKNSKESKWVPWELGLADGYKGLSRIALFPSADSAHDTTWAESEYLGLYDRIVWGRMKDYREPLWMVLDHKANTATPLSNWLAA